MNPIVRNIFGFIAGIICGGVVNFGLINIGHSVFPIEGVDPNDMEAMSTAMADLDPEFFIFPFLAHAVGTFVGAIVAGFLAATSKMKLAIGIGIFFLLGGIAAALMIAAPTWFVVVDLVAAYIPFAWFGGIMAQRRAKNKL